MNDDGLEILLRDAFRAHESLADPDRARALVPSSCRPKRRWAMVLSNAAAVLLVVGLVTYAVGRDEPRDDSLPVATPTPTPTSDKDEPPPTDADYRAMAAAASERTLAKTPVPEGALRLEGQPPGWPKDYGLSVGPSDQRLTRTAWWSVPMGTDALAEFLASHEAEGLRHNPGEDVISCGNDFGICSTTYDPLRQNHPEAYSEPTLLVQFTAAGDRSLMRADTFTFARPVRPLGSYLTAPVTSVGIDRVVPSSQGVHNVREPHVEVTDPDLVDQLVEAVNGALRPSRVGGFLSLPRRSVAEPEPAVRHGVWGSPGPWKACLLGRSNRHPRRTAHRPRTGPRRHRRGRRTGPPPELSPSREATTRPGPSSCFRIRRGHVLVGRGGSEERTSRQPL